jgi:hypothetical protein
LLRCAANVPCYHKFPHSAAECKQKFVLTLFPAEMGERIADNSFSLKQFHPAQGLQPLCSGSLRERLRLPGTPPTACG